MHKHKIKPTVTKDTVRIKGEYHRIKDWVMDDKGYFLIRVRKEEGILELGFCKKNNVIETIVEGKTPQEIYYTVCEKKLVSRHDHAAYLGKELEKAYLALKYDLDYVQDEELNL